MIIITKMFRHIT